MCFPKGKPTSISFALICIQIFKIPPNWCVHIWRCVTSAWRLNHYITGKNSRPETQISFVLNTSFCKEEIQRGAKGSGPFHLSLSRNWSSKNVRKQSQNECPNHLPQTCQQWRWVTLSCLPKIVIIGWLNKMILITKNKMCVRVSLKEQNLKNMLIFVGNNYQFWRECYKPYNYKVNESVAAINFPWQHFKRKSIKYEW